MPLTADTDLLNSGYRYALSLCSVKQDAEDLVHDAWLRLIKRHASNTDKALFFRIIRNLYIDQYRKKQRAIAAAQLDIAQIDQPPTNDLEKQYAEAEAMQHRLSALRDVEREVLYLSVVEGYTADEIAALTLSVRGTVLSLIHRAKKRLRKNEEAAHTSHGGKVVQMADFGGKK